MNRLITTALVIAIALLSCVKKNTPEIPLNNNVDTTMAMQQQRGIFMNGPYGTVSGRAVVYKEGGRLILSLQDMRISNGPQLHVYLSKEVQPVNFIDLGPLQSTLGNQLYDINGTVDFSVYRYALIHCKKYDHLFGSASLQ
jgi:hypothetical protein